MSGSEGKDRGALGELARFVLVGGLSTMLHWLIYRAALPWCQVYVAYTAGYLVSFLFNFLATSYVTFRTRPTWTRMWGMAGAHAVNYGVHIALLALVLRMGMPERWAPVPVYCVAVPVNFLLVRFVFKNTREGQ